jgi:outer membrane receptor protein involved in Fe transport
MNWKTLFFVLWPCRRRYLPAILAGALLPFTLSAQEGEEVTEVKGEEEEDILELSPFVVDESADKGYYANNTLVGTRIRSNLDDLAASITVINEQFMEDTSSVDIRDALIYVANAESPTNHYNPGSDNGTVAGGGYPSTQNTSRYEGRKNRLRGLRPATITRDLFISDITPDAYNMERMEINRGPNSVLFGLGSPAGVINYTTKRARFQNSTVLKARFGSFGQWRGSFDVNRLLMDNEKYGQVAVRVAGLLEHRERHIEKYFEDDERLYIAGVYSPRPNTTFRMNAEVARGRAARVRPMPPLDGYTGWIAAGRPLWNPLEHMNERARLPDWFLLDAGHFNYEANGTFLSAMMREGPLNSATSIIPSVTTKGLWQGGAQGSALSFDFFGAQAILDTAIFDFFNHNFMPPSPATYHNDDLVTWAAAFEQVFFKDKSAGFKVSYGTEEYHNWSRDPLWQSQTKILVDPNTHLPNGDVNPNVGRPYIEGYTLMHDEEKDRDTLRVEAYWDINLEDKVHGWLGRHKISFLYNKRTDERQLLSGNEGIRGQDLPNELFGAVGRQPNNAMWRRWYLADSIDDLPLARPTDYDLFLTGDKPVLWWDTDATSVDPTTGVEGPWSRINSFGEEVFITQGAFVEGGQFHLEEQWTGGSITRNEVESTAAVIQSFWFKKGDGDGHFVVSTLGFRNDEFVGFAKNRILDSLGFPELDRRVWTFDSTPTATVGGDTFTLGIVGHVLPWASVHYSDSENFEASGVRTSGTGVTLGVPTGTTEEYGFSLKLLKGKLYAKVNWYETNQMNASDSGGLFRWRIPGVENRFYKELRLIDRLDLWTDPNFGYGLNLDDGEMTSGSGNIPGLTDVANSTTTGMEIEVVVNPFPNWRVMFNVGQSKAFLKNRQFYTAQYVDERTPAWQKFWDLPSSGNFCTLNWGATMKDCYNGLLGSVLAGNLLFEGRPTQQLREWRWNFVTTYDFQEGFLKNVSVGGAGRWEQGAKIGNPVIFTADGTPTSDLDNPYSGPERFNVDLWVGYHRKIFDGRMNWKIQLNLRNAFTDKNSTYPTHAQPDGSYQLIAISEPPEFFITNTISF